MIKKNLPVTVPEKIQQGATVVAKSTVVISGPQPLIDALDVATKDLAAKQMNLTSKKGALKEAAAAQKASTQWFTTAYNNLGNHVDTLSEGSASFILSTGFGVRANPSPIPSPVAPTRLAVKMGNDPGSVLITWKKVEGARNFEVQYTTDLTGETDWISADETPAAGRLLVGDLDSGVRYAFRVRALSNSLPGPFAGPIQQMAP